MLVLTRKSSQSIMIGDEIEVSVLAVTGDKVRLGIEAPRSIPVYRKEVYVEIRDEPGSPEGKAAAPAGGQEAGASGESVDEALDRLKSGE